jgi:DNA repair protein RadD
MGYSIFHPEIEEDRPGRGTVPVEVACPECGHINDFWGLRDEEGELLEHYGRKCQGARQDPQNLSWLACEFRFRFKRCPDCGTENDTAARVCRSCEAVLVDADKKLREAMSLKDAHVMKPDSMSFEQRWDKRGQAFVEIRYYDLDGEHLKEFYYLNTPSEQKAFYFNFLRMHHRLPERATASCSLDQLLSMQRQLRMPLYLIARKKKSFWEIREKIFDAP